MRRNTITLMIYEIAIYLAPLITAPYIARVLGPYGTGVYSYTYSIAAYFILFIQLGVSLYGRREIAAQNDKETINRTFWGIFASTSIMFFLVSLLYFVSIFIFLDDYKIPMLCQYLLLISAWLDISWLFFGLEKFKVAVTRSLIVKFLSLILIFTFIKTSTDITKYIIIMGASNLLSVMVMWVTLKKYIGKSKISFSDIKVHYKNLFVLFIPILAVQLYSITDKVCLGILNSVDSVGIYEIVYKISRVPISMITAIGTVMLPRTTKLISKGKNEEALIYIDKSLSITLILAIGCTFGLISISEPFVKIYLGSEFMAGAPILRLLSLVLIIIAWGNVFRMQYILPNKMDKLYLKSVVSAAVINIILNIILIPILGGVGAAIASVISEFIICVYQSFKIRNSFNLKRLLYKNLKYFVAGIVMCITVTYFGKILSINQFINLLIQILIGVVSYMIMLIILELKSDEKVFTNEVNLVIRKICNFMSKNNNNKLKN